MPDVSPMAEFVTCLEQVLGRPAAPIPLHEPEFAGNEWAYVKECLDTGWVSSVGKFVDQFESRLANFTGAKHAIAVVNGTAGLHVALQVAGVTAGDEVFVPALTFVATANAVSHCGAIPHFVDSSEKDFGIDVDALAKYLERVAEPLAGGGYRNRLTGRRLAAVVPMHVFGRPMEIDSLLTIADRYRLPVIEDAAESLGSFAGGKHTGTFGRMGVLSFNGNKIITTGGGGAVLTNCDETARHLKHLTTTAKLPHRWEFIHDEVAYNYRLPNLNAALGCAQLERLPNLLLRKKTLADRYAVAFSKTQNLSFTDTAGSGSNCWLNSIRIVDGNVEARDELLQAAMEAGYHCRPVWRLLHRLPMYRECPCGDLRVAEKLERELINLPSSAYLSGRAGD